MSAMHTGDGHHHTEVKSYPVRSLGRQIKVTVFYAVCDCGWQGIDQPRRDEADEDADEHVRLAS